MLERWQAVRFSGILENGRTKPMIVECQKVGDAIIDPERARGPVRKDFVVKALGNPEVDPTYITKELLGNVLARAYGLETPEPAVILITEAFARAVNPVLRQHGFQIKPGRAAGCEYLRAGFTFPPSEALLSEDELEQMAQLYGFDLAVQNPDRLPHRPNCALKSGKLVAFDFDACFSFLYVIGAIGEPWEISKHGIASRHLCHRKLKLKRETLNWHSNTVAISAFSDAILEKVTGWIDDDWSQSALKVRSHLAAIRDHVDQFEFELQGSIS